MIFLRHDCIYVTYANDILVFAKENYTITDLLSNLKNIGATIKLESNVAGYLEFHIKRLDDGRIIMTQTVLTKRIIKAMGLEESNTKHTPTNRGTSPLDSEGLLGNELFNYTNLCSQPLCLLYF